MNMVAHSSSNPLRFSFGKKYQEPWFPQFCSLSLHPYSYTICDGCIAAEDRSSAPLVFVQDDKSKITSHRKDHFLFRDHGRSVYSNVNVWISMTSFSNDIQSIMQSSNLLCNEYKLDNIFECFIHCFVTSQPDAWVKVTQFFCIICNW